MLDHFSYRQAMRICIKMRDGEYYEGGERESPYRNQESQGKRNIGINHPRPSETFFPPNWTNRFSKQPIYYAVFPTSLRLVFFWGINKEWLSKLVKKTFWPHPLPCKSAIVSLLLHNSHSVVHYWLSPPPPSLDVLYVPPWPIPEKKWLKSWLLGAFLAISICHTLGQR